ncbi:EthD family reductase [Halobacteriales archaeon QS_8_69_26]|nr:MAG: EthD family reductase [Halobacteriales archaeon QS_8_69_26]
MIKQVILLDRKEGMSFEDFEDHWLNEHAPLLDDMPNVEGYTVDLPTDPEKSPFDGVAQVYFQDEDAMAEAWESEAGQAVQKDTPTFVDTETQQVMVVEEHVQIPRGEDGP